MRQFYELCLDARPNDRERVCDYFLGEFDSSVFRICRWFQEPFPPDVKLWLQPGSPAGVLGEPLSWPIWSEKLVSVVRPYANSDIQEIAPPLFDVNTDAPVTGFRIVNILRSLEVIDLSKSVTSEMEILGTTILIVIRAVYRDSAISSDVHIFRAKESLDRILISDELFEAIWGSARGAALIKVEMVP